MSSLSIHNFGCRVNQAESFTWADEFQKRGFRLVDDFSTSDLVLINSCTLTHRSDRDVRQFIKKVSRLNPKAKVVVTGCLVERAPEELEKMPQVWRTFRNYEKNEIASEILSLLGESNEPGMRARPFRSRALLKIQDGCDFQCAFCIIPEVRGKSRSAPLEEIIFRAKRFIKEGYREIVLTGIHICSYGLDLTPRSSLLALLHEVEEIEDSSKIRLSSLDPRFLTNPLIGYLTSSQKICNHFHISLQHGSDRILKQMARKVRVSDYRRILEKLRKNSPEASIGADIIVGFPGESEKDFDLTYEFLKESPMTYFHVFSYSPRPNTPASKWPQVDEKTKKDRSLILRNLSVEKNMNFRRQFVGKELEGIVIRKKESQGEVLTSNYFKVLVPLCAAEEREQVLVRILKVKERETIGELVGS